MKYREVVKKLASLGCQELPTSGGGSHRKWLNPMTHDITVVPDCMAVLPDPQFVTRNEARP